MKNLGSDPAYDVTYKAPVLIIISSGKDSVSGEVDCAAAMEHMMLAAESMGIASCWMGFVGFIFKDNDMMRRLGVPEGFKPQQAAVFGYRAGEKADAPERSLDAVTFTGTF
jgi:nitroreductase